MAIDTKASVISSTPHPKRQFNEPNDTDGKSETGYGTGVSGESGDIFPPDCSVISKSCGNDHTKKSVILKDISNRDELAVDEIKQKQVTIVNNNQTTDKPQKDYTTECSVIENTTLKPNRKTRTKKSAPQKAISIKNLESLDPFKAPTHNYLNVVKAESPGNASPHSVIGCIKNCCVIESSLKPNSKTRTKKSAPQKDILSKDQLDENKIKSLESSDLFEPISTISNCTDSKQTKLGQGVTLRLGSVTIVPSAYGLIDDRTLCQHHNNQTTEYVPQKDWTTDCNVTENTTLKPNRKTRTKKSAPQKDISNSDELKRDEIELQKENAKDVSPENTEVGQRVEQRSQSVELFGLSINSYNCTDPIQVEKVSPGNASHHSVVDCTTDRSVIDPTVLEKPPVRRKAGRNKENPSLSKSKTSAKVKIITERQMRPRKPFENNSANVLKSSTPPTETNPKVNNTIQLNSDIEMIHKANPESERIIKTKRFATNNPRKRKDIQAKDIGEVKKSKQPECNCGHVHLGSFGSMDGNRKAK